MIILDAFGRVHRRRCADEMSVAAGLFRKKSIALPGGGKVSPRTASAVAIDAAAAALLAARVRSSSVVVRGLIHHD